MVWGAAAKALLLTLCASVAACGATASLVYDGGPTDAAGQDQATADAADGGDADVTVAEAGDAAPLDASDAGVDCAFNPGDAALGGTVGFAEFQGGGGQFSANFYPAGPIAALPGCTLTHQASCVVEACPNGNPTLDGGGGAYCPLPTAGTLTITGGTLGASGVAVLPDPATGYYSYGPGGPLFSPGDALAVAATGADVPAFPAHSIVLPGYITLVSPQPATDAGAMVIPTSQDLAVSWTGGQAGSTVALEATADFSNGGYAVVDCSWASTAGQGTVPKAMLAALVSGPPQSGYLFWFQSTVAPFDAGAWAIDYAAVTSSGHAATYQ